MALWGTGTGAQGDGAPTTVAGTSTDASRPRRRPPRPSTIGGAAHHRFLPVLLLAEQHRLQDRSNTRRRIWDRAADAPATDSDPATRAARLRRLV